MHPHDPPHAELRFVPSPRVALRENLQAGAVVLVVGLAVFLLGGDGDPGATIGIPLFAAVVVFATYTLRFHLGPRWLEIGDDGIEIQGRSGRRHLRWDEMAETRRTRRAGNAWVLRPRQGAGRAVNLWLDGFTDDQVARIDRLIRGRGSVHPDAAPPVPPVEGPGVVLPNAPAPAPIAAAPPEGAMVGGALERVEEEGAAPAEGGDGITVVRGSGDHRVWNGIRYRTGLSAANVGAKQLSMNVATIPPGAVARAHVHVGFEVMLFILQGRVRHEYGPRLERSVQNGAGDFIFIEPGVPHEVFNLSDTEPVVAVVARSDASEWQNIVPFERPAE